MVRGYRDFYYNVKEMARAVRFYETAFGMKPAPHGSEYWTTMTLGNLSLGLHWTEGGDVPAIPHDDHGPFTGGVLTLESDDIAADRQQIETAGGKVLSEAKQAWGHMLVFADLDGNILKLMKPNAR